MTQCPYCGHENIPGDDVCAECQHSLSEFHLPSPASEVERALLSDRVGELQPNTPLVVSSGTPVGEVLKILVDHEIGCLLVEDDGALVGIFSERDSLIKIGADVEQRRGEPVSKFMTPAPETLKATAKVAFAVQRMDLGGYRHVPIVNEHGKTEGVISVRDILRYLTSKMHAQG